MWPVSYRQVICITIRTGNPSFYLFVYLLCVCVCVCVCVRVCTHRHRHSHMYAVHHCTSQDGKCFLYQSSSTAKSGGTGSTIPGKYDHLVKMVTTGFLLCKSRFFFLHLADHLWGGTLATSKYPFPQHLSN